MSLSLILDEVGERKILGPELVQQTKEKIELIRQRLVAAQNRQSKYADQHRKIRNLKQEI